MSNSRKPSTLCEEEMNDMRLFLRQNVTTSSIPSQHRIREHFLCQIQDGKPEFPRDLLGGKKHAVFPFFKEYLHSWRQSLHVRTIHGVVL